MTENKKRKYTQAQNKATQKYIKNNYDDVRLRIPKGKKDLIKNYAETKGESLNGYIKKSITQRIEAETGDKVEL